MKGTHRRLQRRVRLLTAQKRRLVCELRAAMARCRRAESCPAHLSAATADHAPYPDDE